MCDKLFPGDCFDEDSSQLYQELEKEIVNTICGHAITELKRVGYEQVNISVPYIIDLDKIDMEKNITKAVVIETNIANINCFMVNL